jgi:hypothetical protein
MTRALSRVQDFSRAAKIRLAGQASTVRLHIGNMVGNVALAAAVALRLHFALLEVHGNAEMGDAAIRERGSASQLGDILHVLRAHAARVVDAYIHEEFVELDILLASRFGQVMELHTRDREHWLAVQLRIVQPVEQMDASGP